MWASSTKSSPPSADRIVGAQVARVGITTLRELRDVLDGLGDAAQIDRLRLDLDHLIDCARWASEALPEVAT